VLYEWKQNFRDWMWSLRKYRCEILDNWDLKNFPFDDHILAIAVIPNADENTSPNYHLLIFASLVLALAASLKATKSREASGRNVASRCSSLSFFSFSTSP
jgi:hypothetical protein